MKAGRTEHPQNVADILLPLVLSIYFCQTVRNIRCHIQGYFLEIEVERALEIIVEKSLETSDLWDGRISCALVILWRK